MRTPLRKGMESTLDIEATRIPQLKTKQRIGLQNKLEQTYDRPHIVSCICWKDILGATEFPPTNSRNFLVMQSGVGDTGEAIYLAQTNNPYIQLYPSVNT